MTDTLADVVIPDAEIVDLDPESDRDTWLGWRDEGLGASDMAGVLGISRWSSPWSIWAEKVGLLPRQEASTVMKAGNYFEDGTRRWFSDETGLTVVGAQMALQSTVLGIARCTADGAIARQPRGVELKFEGPGRAWAEIPAQYQAQGQWQMFVAGWEAVHFGVIHGRNPDFDHVLERDEADIALMYERGEQFWVEHVVAGVPPMVDGSDATERALKAIYPHGDPGADRVDLGELTAVLAEWREAKAEAGAAEKRAKAAANTIRAALGDATEGEVDGSLVVTCREQTRRETVQAASTFRVLRPVTSKES